MSYPPFQFKMTPIRYSRPGSGFDPRSKSGKIGLMGPLDTATLPGREHPVETCNNKCGQQTVQKYFWDDPYDLPIYDPDSKAMRQDYRDTMILGQFNPKDRQRPWITFRRKHPKELNGLDPDGSVLDLKETFGFPIYLNPRIIVIIVAILLVTWWLRKKI